MEEQKTIRVFTFVTAKKRGDVKAAAAIAGVTMLDWVEQAIDDKMASKKSGPST